MVKWVIENNPDSLPSAQMAKVAASVSLGVEINHLENFKEGHKMIR